MFSLKGVVTVRRDKEAIRRLMLSLREGAVFDRVEDSSNIYHIELLVQAGWVEWDDCFSCEEFHLYNRLRLTWEGCEVADLLSDHYKWDKVKSKHLIDAPFSIILDYIKD